MNLFNKDPLKGQKQFYKYQWEVQEETRKTAGTYVNQEAATLENQGWGEKLSQKREELELPDYLQEYYTNQ